MLIIKNIRTIDPASDLDDMRTITIGEDGKIAKIEKEAVAEETGADLVIDGTGLVAAPGFVDVHVHFRDPGFTYKEDIVTGSAAAAAGGYTSVVCMANTKPPIDHPQVLSQLVAREKELPIHVYQAANVTMGMQGQELTDMDALLAAGAVGFTDDGVPIADEKLMVAALKKCKELDVPISLHEEDPALMLSPGVNKGKVSDQLGLGGAPAQAEYVLAGRDILLNKEIGAKLDIQHISSAVTVDLIRKAKAEGLTVFGEVTPQHLYTTEDRVLERGSLARVNPPLRTEEDRQALIRGLADGTLDMIATDHAPHSKEEKEKPIAQAPSGMIGLETALGLVMTAVVKPGHASLNQVIRALTVNPAKIYGLDAGKIEVGGAGDLVLFDPDEEWTVPDHFASKATNSPFIGDRLVGRVKYTICGGRVVYQDR